MAVMVYISTGRPGWLSQMRVWLVMRLLMLDVMIEHEIFSAAVVIGSLNRQAISALICHLLKKKMPSV